MGTFQGTGSGLDFAPFGHVSSFHSYIDAVDEHLLLLHLACAIFMTGLIWMVQLVHYPLMGLVGPQTFAEYHAEHSRRITYIVGPVMSLELLTGAFLLYPLDVIPAWLALGNIALVLATWAATGLVQVPRHKLLSQSFDETVHRQLVNTNWVRTFAWTIRSVALCGYLASVL